MAALQPFEDQIKLQSAIPSAPGDLTYRQHLNVPLALWLLSHEQGSPLRGGGTWTGNRRKDGI